MRACGQGPPTSIQLPSGRIIVPTAFCYNGGSGRCKSQAPGDWFAGVLFSDDLGAKNARTFCAIYTLNDHFTKTVSGQT